MPRLVIDTWPYALVFWGVFLWAFAPEFAIISRRREPSATAQDARSKQVIAIGQGVAMFAAFGIAATNAGAIAHRLWAFWVGLAALGIGSLLRRHCWRMLGASFTGAVIVTPGQAVVERGAYRYVRHPSYTAGALMLVGVALALGNWISVLVVAAGVGIVYGYRVQVEERALRSVLGEPYERYRRRTKRFLPFVY
jgi:protein-S-isoprenylcysteine O-methyltransferase Ste14